MLEGLEVNEIKLSSISENKDYRIDSQFYTKRLYKNLALNYIKIGKALKRSQYGLSIEMNENSNGYPIYRMNEIHSMMCDLEVSKYACIKSEDFELFQLNDRDVLFNRTNSFDFVGRTGLYKTHTNNQFIFASYLVRFIPNQEYILPEYLTAFLNCKYGIAEVKRRARQSINQTNVNPEEVKEIDIPLLDIKIQDKIKRCFDQAHSARIISTSLYQEAEQMLLKELDLLDFKPLRENIAIKKLSESFAPTGRLDAEYYQPKYEEIVGRIKKYRCNFCELNDLIIDYSTGYPYKSESYQDEGISLIRINNIKSGILDLSNATKIPYKDKNLSKKDIVKENDLLISMSGTIGSACKIHKDIEAVVNQRIMRVTINNFSPDIAVLLINSFVGVIQLERIGTGGVQTNISANDIKQILIPLISTELQQKIESKIQQSFALRKESQELLDLAKKAVEVAIEQDEEVALKLIEPYLTSEL